MAGEGSIFLMASSGKWVAQITVHSRGKRRYLTETLGPIEPTERQKKAAFTRLRVKANAPAAKTAETTGAYLARWVNEARNIRQTTRHGYGSAIVTHIAPVLGHVPLSELAPRDVERMLGRFEVTLTPKTARNAHAVLRRALGQAVKLGLIERNPASREYVEAPRVSTREPVAFTDAEIDALLAASREDRIGPLIAAAVETGLRQGELLGLAWQDLGKEPWTALQVDMELAYIDGRYQRSDPKTPLSRRRVPLSDIAREAFAEQERRLKQAGFVTVSTGPVFVNHRGKALTGDWVTHRLHELEVIAGVRPLPFKNLRTTFASRLNERGADEATIARLLGHAPGSRTTARHYIASSEAMARSAIELLNQSRKEGTA